MIEKYPKVIQLPITLKCNSKCVMCNVWNMNHSDEMDIDEFSRYMQDSIFHKVEAVGINGGEPSLIENLPEYANEILKLPSLKSLNIISNGFNKKALLDIVKKIYENCKNKHVSFHISLSLDGYSSVHDEVRGINGAFEKTVLTIDEIIKNQHSYCDSYDIGCTVVNQNINNLVELDTYAKSKNYNMKYRLGIENKRIESDKLSSKYSVLSNENRQTAKEFFHYKMIDSKTEQDRFKYFSIFYYLDLKVPNRLLGCAWKEDGITLDSKGNIYYCAVESKCIGSLADEKGERIFFNDKNLEYRKSIIDTKCSSCIHDYSGDVTDDSKYIYLKYMADNNISMDIYKIKAKEL